MIHQELEKLKIELEKLESAAREFQRVGEASGIIAENARSLSDGYTAHIKQVEHLIRTQIDKRTEALLGVSQELTEKLDEIDRKAEMKFEEPVSAMMELTQRAGGQIDAIRDLIFKHDQVDFPIRLDSIEKTIKETIAILNDTRESTLEELKQASEIITKADFDGRFKNLQSSIDSSVKSNEELSNSIEKQKLPEKIDGFEKNITKKLEASISELQKNTQLISTETTKSIHDLNIPIRIDKLDSTVSSINQGIQTTQQRVGDLERNIKDDVLSKQKELIAKIESVESATKQRIDNSEKEFTKMFERISKENNLLKILLFVSIGLILFLAINVPGRFP